MNLQHEGVNPLTFLLKSFIKEVLDGLKYASELQKESELQNVAGVFLELDN